MVGAVLGSAFFLSKGWLAVILAAALGSIAMELGGRIATRLQQFGADVQQKTREEFGQDSPLTAFVIGLTLGLVWVPCAGPALGFAFTLVREEPGVRAILALASYGLGTAVPLLLIGYGGQAVVHSTRRVSQYSGIIKQVAGALLILTAIALQFRLFEKAQIWLLDHTNFGDLGTRIEEKLFERDMFEIEDTGVKDATEKENEGLMIQDDPPAEKKDEVVKKESLMEDQKTMEKDGTVQKMQKSPSSASSIKLPTLPKLSRAPEFTDLGPWHNSEPFTLASLKGKVVLVDFWTYSCINCIRTLPYIQGYWEKFKDKPFVLIGVHSPEFVFEKSEANVKDAIARHGLTYPVAQDNDFGTWIAFSNRYWPAKYLIDAEGYIRYAHFGEGAYEETDLAIQSLLAESGHSIEAKPMPEEEQESRREQSPETYLGSRSWSALGNSQGDPSDMVISYKAPASMQLHNYHLVGEWQLMDDERQTLRSSEGEIRMRFLGSEINLVLGLAKGTGPVQASVEVDGKHVQELTINRHDLYQLYTGSYGEHDILVKIQGNGAEAYAFTFGS
jgi:sulfite exporter TauE/SafE/thiol-disulfide isomerase/thioredoxin